MVVGIPNVGKSTFINSFAGKACAKTGNKPGVTKGKQWIRLNKGLELLDTPGILWPKFEDQQVGMRLAFIGSMNDEILIPDELACDLIGAIKELYPKALQERYEADPAGKPIEILEAVAETEGLDVTEEEVEIAVAQLAAQYQVNLAAMKNALDMDALRQNLRINKAASLIADSAVEIF